MLALQLPIVFDRITFYRYPLNGLANLGTEGVIVMRTQKSATDVISIEAGLKAIDELDLSNVMRRLQSPPPRGKNWTPSKAADAEKWYRRFLAVTLKHSTEVTAPNEDVDEVWHMHILDMHQYEEDTKRIFGHVLYHKPTFGNIDLTGQFRTTNELLRKEFGEEPPSTEHYAPASCCSGSNVTKEELNAALGIAV